MNFLSRMVLPCLAISALAGPGLHAADTSFGLQGGFMLPMGDLRTFTDNSIGFGFGGHLLVDLGHGQTVRPRLDFYSYPGRTGYFRLQQMSGGADYVYFTEGSVNHGLYLVAGAGIASNTYETFVPGYSKAYDNPYVALGIGYQVDAIWGIEFRYNSSRFTDQNGTATSVNATGLSATARF